MEDRRKSNYEVERALILLLPRYERIYQRLDNRDFVLISNGGKAMAIYSAAALVEVSQSIIIFE